MAAQGDKATKTSGRAATWTVVAVVAGLLGLVLLWKTLPMNEYVRQGIEWIDSLGPMGVLMFYLAFVVSAVVGIPRTPLNIAAGVLFSFPVALAVVLAGALSAYFLTFTIARSVAREWVARRVARAPNVKRLLDLVDEEGFKLVLLIRMNPFIPGVLKGYGFGTTKISLPIYLVASLLGFLPIALAHVYLGWAGGAAMMHSGAGPTRLQQWLLAGGLVISLVLILGVFTYGKRAMNRRYGKAQAA